MIVQNYFHVQKITFAGVGINPMVTDPKDVVKHPLLCYGLLISTFFHMVIIVHYILTHIKEYDEVTDSFPLMCQAILSIWKMSIFLSKRKDILRLINELHQLNLKAQLDELTIVRRENSNDAFVSNIYFKIVLATGTFAFIHPAIYGLYVYITSGKLVLVEANKATYFWNYTHIGGYSIVFLLNFLTSYYVCDVSLAIDTLFTWFVRNILAQFQILMHRFHQVADQCNKDARQGTGPGSTQYREPKKFFSAIIKCIQYHRQTLALADRLNQVYGEIIFIKFIIVCSEICSLVFSVSRPNYSMFDAVYKALFLTAVTLQLSLYCYNGQRIKDESMLVSTEIYNAFDWSHLGNSYKKLLLLPLMRAQKPSHLKGVFFEVDLSLYLWVLKTAGSLLTALKTLEEKQD
ncbi:odorant receptor 45a-like [Lucilia sericata]|uniref:odorant receptor 45a-like n=1 Tax=Lucilia sericata TaxID=13632 RepID=UPI0018A853DF|nr:odorant receptor 45a-like [Lucilia sericata]